jgi:hypothetical protein
MLCQWKAGGGADVLPGCPGPLTSFSVEVLAAVIWELRYLTLPYLTWYQEPNYQVLYRTFQVEVQQKSLPLLVRNLLSVVYHNSDITVLPCLANHVRDLRRDASAAIMRALSTSDMTPTSSRLSDSPLLSRR